MKIELFQSPLWGDMKSRFGWANRFIKLENEKILILIRPISRFFKIVYIPYGFSDSKMLNHKNKELISNLKSIIPGLLFVRFDLSDSIESELLEGINHNFNFQLPKYLKKSSDIQPPDTVVLYLQDEKQIVGEENLLSKMHKKTRYNIKLSNKKGVVVKNCSVERLQDWYELYQITAKRDKITIHTYEYYKTLFELTNLYKDDFKLDLYLAEHEDDLLAGIIVAQYKGQAIYLYGASSNEKRNLMPAYALQWEAIKNAMNSGAKTYDFYGIPPADDPSHPMHGLYRFKTGFGGKLIHRPGAYDQPVKGFYYFLFRCVEKLRYFYFKRIKKGALFGN